MRRIQRFCNRVFFFGGLILASACSKPNADSILKTHFQGLKASYRCISYDEKSQRWFSTPLTPKGEKPTEIIRRCYYQVEPQNKETGESASNPTGLLVALHPAFHGIAELEEMAHIVRPVEAASLIALYPEGIDKQWNDGRHAEKSRSFRENTADIAFLETIIRDSQREFKIPISKTTVAGMSNGAMMAQRMACESPYIGRIFSVAGNLPQAIASACHVLPSLQKAVFVWGKDDNIVPYQGGALSVPASDWGAVLSAEETENHFAHLLRCNQGFRHYELERNSTDDSTVYKNDFDCRYNQQLSSYHVKGMGHTWPGEKNHFQAFINGRGDITDEIDANRLLIDIALSR